MTCFICKSTVETRFVFVNLEISTLSFLNIIQKLFLRTKTSVSLIRWFWKLLLTKISPSKRLHFTDIAKHSSFCPASIANDSSFHSIEIFFQLDGRHWHFRLLNLKNALRNKGLCHSDDLFNRRIKWKSKTVEEEEMCEVKETTFLPGCFCDFLRRVV